jgi:Rad3-related DNA helicase
MTASQTTNRVQAFLAERLPRRAGYQANPVQMAYAGSMTGALAQPGKLHFIEGDTGIGKSLAYSLALADWVARGKGQEKSIARRAIVATYTRALQRQLLAPEHLGLIAEYLSLEGLPEVSVGLRMGRGNYASPERLTRALGAPDLATVAKDRSRPAEERSLAQWTLETPGCLLDLEPDALPEGLTLADICLLPQEPLPRALEAHFQAAQGHDILIINHALLALDLVTAGSITGAQTPYALLLDEADRFPDAAESILSEQLSLRASQALLEQLGVRAAHAWRELLDGWTTPAQAGRALPLSAPQRQQLVAAFQALRRARPNLDAVSGALAAEWHRLMAQVELMAMRLQDSPDSPLLVSHSPVMGLPSLVAQEPAAGRCLKSGAEARTTILTSATLSDMQHALGEVPSFDYLRGRLQLGTADTRLGTRESHPAMRFGRMRFTLPDDMPLPLWQPEAGRYALSPTFCAMATRRIRSLSGRVLVLASAYSDVAAIRSAWPQADTRLVTHAPGANLNQLAEALAENAVFATPAGWEGLSPARGERAFWDHLVILRLPHPTPDPVLQALLEQQFMRHGHRSREEASKLARQVLLKQAGIRATHKLRQGLGRGIRHPDDDVHVVILDPRFPSPSGTPAGEGLRRHAQSLGAIPPRFLAAYRNARTTWPEEPAPGTPDDGEPDAAWARFL